MNGFKRVHIVTFGLGVMIVAFNAVYFGVTGFATEVDKEPGENWSAIDKGTTAAEVSDSAKGKDLDGYQSGLLRGKGTVDGNLINDANVDPGLGFVGSFTLTGDYLQTAQGDLFVDLSGTSLSLFAIA